MSILRDEAKRSVVIMRLASKHLGEDGSPNSSRVLDTQADKLAKALEGDGPRVEIGPRVSMVTDNREEWEKGPTLGKGDS